jgi:hypothetical protein
LELADLPEPDVLQGQSLVPLLLGEPGWEPRPVIFDEFNDPEGTGELSGFIEMIDGRWGASLWIGDLSVTAPVGDPRYRRRWPDYTPEAARLPLLLYDIVEDPMALHPVNDGHPDLVAKYTDMLTRQFEANQLLAKRFTPGGAIELTGEQLESLRSLGYIR